LQSRENAIAPHEYIYKNQVSSHSVAGENTLLQYLITQPNALFQLSEKPNYRKYNGRPSTEARSSNFDLHLCDA